MSRKNFRTSICIVMLLATTATTATGQQTSVTNSNAANVAAAKVTSATKGTSATKSASATKSTSAANRPALNANSGGLFDGEREEAQEKDRKTTKSGDSPTSDAAGQQTSEKDTQRRLDDAADQHREDRPGQNLPPTRRTSESRYRVEFGVLPHYNNNYFQAVEGTPRTDVFITTLSANFGYDLMRRDDKTLDVELRLRRNLFSDLRNANSTDIDAILGYDFGRNRVELSYFGTPRRLSSFEDDPVAFQNTSIFNSVNGGSLQYSRRFTSRLRGRASYELAREIYTDLKERDVTRHRFATDVRYRVRPFFTPGIGYEYGRNLARSEVFSRRSNALLLLAGSNIRDILTMSLRYRFAVREYTTNNPRSSNFGRRDHRHDVNFYSTVNLPKGFSIYGFISTNNNNSSRANRSFTAYDTGLGLFFRFPSR